MQPTLLILAAGMASRYGSMKQTEGFGPSGETIMDYSIYDAIKAGFGKIVFIIRKDFAENFKANFDNRFKGQIKVDYVFQEMTSFVDPADIPADRTKPWGTGHAILCAKDVVKEPFAVINADDFYGFDAFKKAADFLTTDCNENTYSIIGYQLDKTLSENGTVSRGVCSVDANNNLVDINERTKIYSKDGKVIYEENEEIKEVDGKSNVSMNFWCFHPSVFEFTSQLFSVFPKENFDNIKAEFFIPIIGDQFIKNNKGSIKVIPTDAQWFGVTYKEDAPGVKASLDALIEAGEYPASLWGN
ncbi:MAG TPA: sugar phosphate nucleotidyltransferase [Ferruginibacter sp.]|nr:sugar phosphate nucleotidyltransferase [Ferruginibacter sp.]